MCLTKLVALKVFLLFLAKPQFSHFKVWPFYHFFLRMLFAPYLAIANQGGLTTAITTMVHMIHILMKLRGPKSKGEERLSMSSPGLKQTNKQKRLSMLRKTSFTKKDSDLKRNVRLIRMRTWNTTRTMKCQLCPQNIVKLLDQGEGKILCKFLVQRSEITFFAASFFFLRNILMKFFFQDQRHGPDDFWQPNSKNGERLDLGVPSLRRLLEVSSEKSGQEILQTAEKAALLETNS